MSWKNKSWTLHVPSTYPAYHSLSWKSLEVSLEVSFFRLVSVFEISLDFSSLFIRLIPSWLTVREFIFESAYFWSSETDSSSVEHVRRRIRQWIYNIWFYYLRNTFWTIFRRSDSGEWTFVESDVVSCEYWWTCSISYSIWILCIYLYSRIRCRRFISPFYHL